MFRGEIWKNKVCTSISGSFGWVRKKIVMSETKLLPSWWNLPNVWSMYQYCQHAFAEGAVRFFFFFHLPYQRILDFAPMKLPVPWRVEQGDPHMSAMSTSDWWFKTLFEAAGWLLDVDVLSMAQKEGSIWTRSIAFVWPIEKGPSAGIVQYWTIEYFGSTPPPGLRTPTFF